MPTYRVKSHAALYDLMRKHSVERRKKLRAAYKRAMEKGADVVRRNAPVAFSELRDNIRGDAKGIHLDAPHSAAVEEGARPHMPPLEPIVEWVKLRHLQSQVPYASRRRLPGKTTLSAAKAVAKMMRPHMAGASVDDEGAVDSAARKVAWAIAKKIEADGTEPTWFVRKSMPEIRRILDREIKRAKASES
jgi:hypothetical protein